MNFSIESYRDECFAQVDALWREVFPDDPPWNHAQTAIPAKLAIGDELFLLARCEEQTIGTVMGGYDGHRGWVYALAVHPRWRRHGVARALMAELENRLRKRGCGKLNLQVRADNAGVVKLYEALGYRVEDRISLGKRLDRAADAT